MVLVVVAADSAPLPVAVMVSIAVDVGTTAVGDTVSVSVGVVWSVPPEVIGVTVVVVLVLDPAFVLQLAVTPAGSPVSTRLAVLLGAKDPPAVTVIASVADFPCMILSGEEVV